MPEYLAPGVYTEEIDTGSKPIEGVSTSTAGMLGVTERGPVNVPILLTSYGDYRRWFGERLLIDDFTNADGAHCYLPHAVEGFFTNSGQLVYVTRVIDTAGAVKASDQLFDRGIAGSLDTMILRAAGEATGTLGNPPLLYVLDPTGLNPGDWIRIGDGSPAEYRQVNAVGNATHIPLAFSLDYPHETGQAVDQFTPAVDGTYTGFKTTVAAPEGSSGLTLVTTVSADVTKLIGAANPLVEIGGQHGEYHFITQVTVVDPLTVNVLLDGPTAMALASGATVTPLVAPVVAHTAHLSVDASVGDAMVFVDNLGGFFNVATDLVLIHAVDTTHNEVRRIGDLADLSVVPGAYEPLAAGSIVEKVDLFNDDRTLTGVGSTTTFTMSAADIASLSPGDKILIDAGGVNQDTETIVSINIVTLTVTVTPAMLHVHGPGGTVTPAFSLKTVTAAAPAGARALSVDNRISLNVGDVIRIGAAPNEEYATVTSIPNRAPTAPDAGTVVIDHPLELARAVGDALRRLKPPVLDPTVPAPPVTIAVDVPAGSEDWIISDLGTYAAPGLGARVTTPTGSVFFHRISTAAAIAPREVSLQTALERPHAAGSPLVGRTPLIDVEALDFGEWGDRLRIAVQDENPGLVSRAQIATIVNPTHIRLSSVSGVEVGSVLELIDPNTGAVVDNAPLKVDFIDRTSNYTLTLDSALTATQIAAQANAVAHGQKLGVRSREFSLSVLLMHQPDPSLPSRSEQVFDSEVYRNLSMDPRHSRYFQTIIGDINGPIRLDDQRPEGQSWYVRVSDINPSEGIRFGPETLVDILPNGTSRPARQALEGGDDSIATLNDDIYIGTDDIDPEKRTGLFTFNNVDEISIVNIPGRFSAVIQGALIDHCELNRYRFAVLDGPAPPDDSLTDVQTQRQQFDTKYAALYHPWLLIEDPFPVDPTKISNYPIPPSGHVVGVYARTDVDRGVHKAPANEVVNGILGLQRILNKPEQEILNPSPVNINVIRDFRVNDRGIRIWGGRVITSDTDWKYVNVRRLLIFIEKSIDDGLQWVVFEPNADPLWARVRRTIGNFLTTVWRNGALEGTKPEEAFFVKCDLTTMTQTDIDNGRLIVVIGVAPVKPAEFVIIRIGLFTAQAS